MKEWFMNNIVKANVALVAVALVAACSPTPKSIEETPAGSQTAEPAETTPQPPAINQQVAVPGESVQLLGTVVTIPFVHRQ